MKIKYYLIDNPMTEDPNDYRAQVTGYEAVTENEIFEYMTRKGSGITTAEAKANYQEFIETHEYFLKQGYGINTEFINARPVIQGVFRDKSDVFDSSRHQVKFNVKLGKYYNQTAKDIKIEKVVPVSNNPQPEEFEDVTSGTVNEILTPGRTAVLTGLRLKFNVDDHEQGIFFVAANNTVNRVNKIITMTNSQVVFIIPAELASGEYTLEVHALPKGNKTVKKGLLKDKLTV
ncbi:DNA-binding domain-containing protein [Gaoshiqia sp. Z1-71]|uniref:DNA-binding domain-containing protein n=1 Tax=Gaoshiqia hydrogeniformans TaxID=3290090 RepID=UPI003BF81225